MIVMPIAASISRHHELICLKTNEGNQQTGSSTSSEFCRFAMSTAQQAVNPQDFASVGVHSSRVQLM